MHYIEKWVTIITILLEILVVYSKIENEEERNLAMEAVGEKFTNHCVWIMINDSLVHINLHNPHITIHNDTLLESEEDWLVFLSSKMLIDEAFCVTFFTVHPPSPTVMARIFNVKETKRYVIMSAPSQKEAQELLTSKFLGFEPNVAIVSKSSSEDWLIHNRQVFSPEGRPKVKLANSWNPTNGLQKTEPLFPDQMRNLFGHTLEGVTLDYMPFTDYDVTPVTLALKPKPSLDFFILEEISKSLNFTYVMYRSKDGHWGTIGEDGKFRGVVGTVQRGLANFSLVLSLILDRNRVVDFSPMYFFDPMTFVTSTKRLDDNWKKLIVPFTGEVWALLLITLVLGCLIYYPLLKYSMVKEKRKINYSSSVVILIGSLFNQNLAYLPENPYGKAFLSLWLIFSIWITSYYTTSLTAGLVLPPNPPTINTLEELLHSKNEYGMNAVKGSEMEMFSSSEVEVHKALLKKMSFFTSDESMRRVADGGYAYIYFKSNIEIIVASEYTDKSGYTNLHIARDVFFPGGYAWSFPRGSNLRDGFSNVMTSLIEAGILDFWLEDLMRLTIKVGEKKLKHSEGDEGMNSGLVVLSLKHLQGAFFLLALGFGISLLAFLLELLIDRIRRTLQPKATTMFQIHHRNSP